MNPIHPLPPGQRRFLLVGIVLLGLAAILIFVADRPLPLRLVAVGTSLAALAALLLAWWQSRPK